MPNPPGKITPPNQTKQSQADPTKPKPKPNHTNLSTENSNNTRPNQPTPSNRTEPNRTQPYNQTKPNHTQSNLRSPASRRRRLEGIFCAPPYPLRKLKPINRCRNPHDSSAKHGSSTIPINHDIPQRLRQQDVVVAQSEFGGYLPF